MVSDLGYERLRIGDVVAMTGQNRYGRGSDSGSCAIGIVAHGIGVIPGHGTGVITIMSGPRERSCSMSIRRPTSAPAWSCRHGRRANLAELVVTAVAVGDDAVMAEPVRDRCRRTHRSRSAGGIYNVKVGMAAMGWAANQVEPGVSIANPDAPANDALAVFACIGNPVTVRTGAAAGATGTVIGKHESFRVYKHVLVHAGDDVLERVAPGDELLVRACGRGMAIDGAPGVACHSLGPELWRAWAPDGGAGRVSVAVTRILPRRSSGWGAVAWPPPRRSPSRRRTRT